MAPKIKIRPSYANDGNYLTRFKQAVEKEDRLSPKSRSNILNSVEGLIALLLLADKEIRQWKRDSEEVEQDQEETLESDVA